MTTRHILLICGVVGLGAFFFQCGVLLAKTSPPAVEFASENFWKYNDIELVKVVKIEDAGKETARAIVKREKQFSAEKGPATKTILMSHFEVIEEKAVGFEGHDTPPGELEPRPPVVTIDAGDELLLCARDANEFVSGVKLAEASEKSGLVQTVAQIAAIRSAGTEAALKDGVTGTDATVVIYSLQALLAAKPGLPDPDFAKRIQAVRDDDAKPLHNRIIINRLLPRFAADADAARKETAQWLRQMFEAGKVLKDDYSFLLFGDLRDSFPTPQERVSYFVSLLKDATRPSTVRAYAAMQLTEKECFDFAKPDSDLSATAYSAILSLVTSDDAELRKTGACMPWAICWRLPPSPVRDALVKQALDVVIPAMGREKNDDTLRYMTAYRQFMEGLVGIGPFAHTRPSAN